MKRSAHPEKHARCKALAPHTHNPCTRVQSHIEETHLSEMGETWEVTFRHNHRVTAGNRQPTCRFAAARAVS